MEMTKVKQERMAKTALHLFLEAWCGVEAKDVEFNCERCEFANVGHCLAKKFIFVEHYREDYPQGAIKEE